MLNDPKEQVSITYEKKGKDGSENVPEAITFGFEGNVYVMKPGEKKKITRAAYTQLQKRMAHWEGKPKNAVVTLKELVIKEEEKAPVGNSGGNYQGKS